MECDAMDNEVEHFVSTCHCAKQQQQQKKTPLPNGNDGVRWFETVVRDNLNISITYRLARAWHEHGKGMMTMEIFVACCHVALGCQTAKTSQKYRIFGDTGSRAHLVASL